jgi:hypothetical protein
LMHAIHSVRRSMEQGRLPPFGSKYIRVFDFVKRARRAGVCPKIAGQLLAVVLQGGRARQNQDTPARGAGALRLFRMQGNCSQLSCMSGRPRRAAPGFGPREGRGGFGPARGPSPSPEAPWTAVRPTGAAEGGEPRCGDGSPGRIFPSNPGDLRRGRHAADRPGDPFRLLRVESGQQPAGGIGQPQRPAAQGEQPQEDPLALFVPFPRPLS